MLKLRSPKAALAAGLAVIAIPAGAATLVAPAQAGSAIHYCKVLQVGKSVTASCTVPSGKTVLMKVVCNSGVVRLSQRVRPGTWKIRSGMCKSGVKKVIFIS